ncbi:MAG TPA: hypothetical protein VF463_12195 [Sphingobium sp.]
MFALLATAVTQDGTDARLALQQNMLRVPLVDDNPGCAIADG